MCLDGKIVFPYEICKDAKTMINCTTLPEKSKFYSSLHEEHVSQEAYNNAKSFFDIYQCKSLMDFARVYCHLDVILLAECFFDFRNLIYKWCKLDAARYLGIKNIKKYLDFC